MATTVDALRMGPAARVPSSPVRAEGSGRLHGRPLDEDGGIAFSDTPQGAWAKPGRPLQCKTTPCQWAGVYDECVMGCQPGAPKPKALDLSDLQPALDAIIYDAGMTTEGKVDGVLKLIGDEVKRAIAKHPPVTDSPHHHYGVLMEEVREFETEVFTDNVRLAREEVLQVAAMAIRFVLEADLAPSRRRPRETPPPRPTCPSCGSHPPYHKAGCTGGVTW